MPVQLSLFIYDLIRLDMSPEQRLAKYRWKRPGGDYLELVGSVVHPLNFGTWSWNSHRRHISEWLTVFHEAWPAVSGWMGTVPCRLAWRWLHTNPWATAFVTLKWWKHGKGAFSDRFVLFWYCLPCHLCCFYLILCKKKYVHGKGSASHIGSWLPSPPHPHPERWLLWFFFPFIFFNVLFVQVNIVFFNSFSML